MALSHFPSLYHSTEGENARCSSGAERLLPVCRIIERADNDDASAGGRSMSPTDFPSLSSNAVVPEPPARTSSRSGVPPVFALALGWPGDSESRENIHQLMSLLPCEGLDVNSLFGREVCERWGSSRARSFADARALLSFGRRTRCRRARSESRPRRRTAWTESSLTTADITLRTGVAHNRWKRRATPSVGMALTTRRFATRALGQT